MHICVCTYIELKSVTFRYSVIPCDNGDDGNGDGDVYHMDEEEDSDDGIFDGNYDDANDESYVSVSVSKR